MTTASHVEIRPAAARAPAAVTAARQRSHDRAPAVPRVGIQDVSAQFGATLAVDRVSLAVAEGEVVCLLGPSGSGKSTLLRLVAGLDRPASGTIAIDGIDVAGASVFVEPEQRRVGMVFQDYALFPHLTIAGNVAMGLRGRPKAAVNETVGAMLDRLDLRRHAGSYPHMLSGGERQRAALARALAPAPRVLLMDEPFSSLDDRLRDRVREQTLEVLRQTQTTTILVTHDPAEALRAGDRIALMRGGRLVQCGRPDEVYRRPATLFAARFFSDVNELPGVCRAGCIETLAGTFAAPQFDERTPACACIRPQDVRLSDTRTPLSGHVVRCSFLGEVEQLEVALPGADVPFRVRCSPGRRFDPGDTVFLQINPDDVLVLRHEEPSRSHHFNGAD
jgi:iron(III) transport system ATP-binding protein